MSGTDKLFVVVSERNTMAAVTRDLAKALKATVMLQPVHVVVIDVEGGQWELFESEFLKMSTDEAIARSLSAAPSDAGSEID